MNPIWLVIWLSSAIPGQPAQKITNYSVFPSSSTAMLSYVIDNIGGDFGTPVILNSQEYELKSKLEFILQKKVLPTTP